MSMDLGTLVARLKVDDSDFDQKTSGWSTKGAAIAPTFGNLAADGISTATSMLMDFVGEAMEASDATDKFRTGLEFAGLDTSTIDSYLASTQAYADETVYALSDIQSITAALASNGIQGPDALATSLGNLNAVAGDNQETFGRLGGVITQTAGAGKLTTENWNQLADAIPGASGLLMDALLQAGAYTGNFREAMTEGQITAEEFNAAITTLGTDPIAVEAAKSTETFGGAIGNLQAAITGGLTAALTDLKPIITDIINWLGEAIGWLRDNPGVVQAFAIVIGVLAAAFVALSVAMWLASLTPIGLIIGAIILGIGLLVAVIWILVANWDAVWAWLGSVMEGFFGWVGGLIEGFVGWWNGIWEAVGQFFEETWNNLVLGVMLILIAWNSWLVGIYTGIASWWNGLWSGIGSFFTRLWSSIVAFVVGVIASYISFAVGAFNGFLSFWNGLWTNVGNFFRDTWINAVAFVQSIPQSILNVFTGAASWLYNIGRDIVQGLWNGLKSIWDSVAAWVANTFGGIVDTVAGIFGIASPSKVFREFGVYIGEGLIDGLERMEDPIDAEFRRIGTIPPIGVPNMDDDDDSGRVVNNKTIHYHAAEHQSLSAQEALFAALGSPRVGF